MYYFNLITSHMCVGLEIETFTYKNRSVCALIKASVETKEITKGKISQFLLMGNITRWVFPSYNLCE